MQFIDKMIKIGGLEYSMDDDEKALTVLSGSKQIIKRKIAVGNKVKYSLLKLNMEWDAFIKSLKNKLNKDENWFKMSDKQASLINDIAQIFGLPSSITTMDSLLYALREIENMSDTQYIIWLSKKYKIYESLYLSIQSVFWCWKMHLENLIIDFNEARTAYIQKYNTNDKINDLPDLITKWKTVDAEFNIEISSIILLFINPPAEPTSLSWITKSANETWKSIPKFHFTISPNSQNADLAKISNLIDNFVNKLSNWLYLGYCPCKPITRFLRLLEFPIKELLDITTSLNPQYFQQKGKNYYKLYNEIKSYKLPKKPNFDTMTDGDMCETPEIPYIINKEKIHDIIEEESIHNTIKISKKIIKKATKLSKSLQTLENYYIKIAFIYNKIVNKFNKHLLNKSSE
jgi:hypothetical protein